MKHAFSCLIFLGLAIAGRPAAAQETSPLTAINGNCRVQFSLTLASSGAQATAWLSGSPPTGSAGTSLVINNTTAGCYGWTVQSHNRGFSAVSLTLQGAPQNSLGTGPGTWATIAVCADPVCKGVNPIVSLTDTTTATQDSSSWVRVNLVSKTGAGTISGTLYGYKYNANEAGSGGTPSTCPGGADTDVQYNSSGSCAGTTGLTADPTRVYFADGAIGAPAIAFGSRHQLGFYKIDNNNIGYPDQGFQFLNSGDTTQRVRIDYNNADIYESTGGSYDVSFRDKVTSRVYGIYSGVGATFGPFGSVISGANSAAFVRVGNQLMGIQNSTGQDAGLQLRASQHSGCTFATLSTCGAVNGTDSYCTDCTITSGVDDTCAGSGPGAAFERINGVYKCRP
jgi:hypothetical protein